MKANDSRIEIVDFAHVPAYPAAEGLPARTGRRGSRLVPSGGAGRLSADSRPDHAVASTNEGDAPRPERFDVRRVSSTNPRQQRFDVRRATCTMQSDTDSLLSTIEAIGSGFDAFNNWMHELLTRSAEPRSGSASPAAQRSTAPAWRGAQSATVHPTSVAEE